MVLSTISMEREREEKKRERERERKSIWLMINSTNPFRSRLGL
jgi:hypothetical protein